MTHVIGNKPTLINDFAESNKIRIFETLEQHKKRCAFTNLLLICCSHSRSQLQTSYKPIDYIK